MTKTELMLIGSRQRLGTLTASPTIRMNSTQVSQVTSTKSLGVIIDDRLDWHSHIEKLTKKIASGIGCLKRVRHLIPASTLHLLYQALVKPHFDYCDIVWGSCGITLRDKLFSWERLSWSLYCDSLVAFHILDHSKWWLKLRPRYFNLLTASCLFNIVDDYEFVLLYHAYSSKPILPYW